jgi:membrane protein
MTGNERLDSRDHSRPLLVEAGFEFIEDRALRLGAGLAYYGLITLAPLAVLLVSIAGLLVGEEAASGQLAESLEQWLGPEVAQAFGEMVAAADVTGSFANLTIFSVIALIFAASILFVAWKDTLNVIWQVAYHPGVKATLARRLFGFASVGALAGLLIVVLVAEAVLAMLAGAVSDEPVLDTAFWIATSVVPLVLGALLLGALYRFGTDGLVSWRAVWPGTILTTGLLLVLSGGYGVYVELSGTSVAGVASSALLLIVLIYFMAQVLLYGAEVIKVQSRRRAGDS